MVCETKRGHAWLRNNTGVAHLLMQRLDTQAPTLCMHGSTVCGCLRGASVGRHVSMCGA